MSYKPGDPVWCRVDAGHEKLGSIGEIAAVIVGKHILSGWWSIDLESADKGWAAPESYLRPRNPPPAKEPTREELGEWDLCPWRPEHVTVSGDSRE